ILVAGPDIGGLAAALALARQGFAVTVLEQTVRGATLRQHHNDLWKGLAPKRFYDALAWLYGWRADNCLATRNRPYDPT
ncbi:MAG: hypothetical protein LH632_22815, partial [Rhodoferax sp.]|nr:hypothetical protein [Rhodoferax sp.]